MKLLFDQNLSRRLVKIINDDFPDSAHVASVHLDRVDDRQIWQFAKDHDFMILSKDTDFLQLSMLHGHPPKVIHLEIGNCSTDDIATLINSSREDIVAFAKDAVESFLILKPK